jgi:hypothetical protein
MAVFSRNGGVGRRGRRLRFTLRSEDREFVFIENKLTEIERRIGELRPTASSQG